MAGPYRAPKRWQVELNIRSAEAHGYALNRFGGGRIFAVVPHLLCRSYDDEFSDSFFLGGTLELMRRCDAVAVAPGWGLSEGTSGELAEAERLHLPRFFQIEPSDQAAAILAHAEQESLQHALTLRLLARRREAA